MTRGLAPRSPPASNAGKPTSATGSLACRPAASSARTPTRPRSPPRRWPAFKVASYSPRCAATPTSSGSPSTQPARTSASPPPEFSASTERGTKDGREVRTARPPRSKARQGSRPCSVSRCRPRARPSGGGNCDLVRVQDQRHALRHLRHFRNRRSPPGAHRRRDPEGTRRGWRRPAGRRSRHSPDRHPRREIAPTSLEYLNAAAASGDPEALIRYVRLDVGDGDEAAGRREIDKAWVQALLPLLDLPEVDRGFVVAEARGQDRATLAHLFFSLHLRQPTGRG